MNTNIPTIRKVQLPAPKAILNSKQSAIVLEQPDSFGVYREDNGAWLGTTGKSHTILQPQAIYDRLDESFPNQVEVSEYKSGAIFNFGVKIDDFSVKTTRSLNDVVSRWLEIKIGYDGSLSLTGDLFVKRLVCLNGMTANVSEEKNKFRNTRSVTMNFQNMIARIDQLHGTASAFADLAQHLADTPFAPSKTNTDTFIKRLVGYDTAEIRDMEEGRSKSIKTNKYNAIERSILHEMNSAGNSLWGLLQGVTWYTNHEVERADQEHYLRFADGASLNKKALNLVTEMVAV